MNILVLNGSPRKDGNTAIMVDEFIRGAQSSGNKVVKFNLGELKIGPCMGCGHCKTHHGECAQSDDMDQIRKALAVADMIVFASPVYWANFTGHMKIVMDRLYAEGMKFHPTCAALLLDSHSPGVFAAIETIYDSICSFLNWENKGIISISGMTEIGDMRKAPEFAEVFNLGKSIIPH